MNLKTNMNVASLLTVSIPPCQGGEGGGHTGDVATSILIPKVVDLCRGRTVSFPTSQLPPSVSFVLLAIECIRRNLISSLTTYVNT